MKRLLTITCHLHVSAACNPVVVSSRSRAEVGHARTGASGNLHYKCWERGSVPLKFQLAEVYLGKVALRLSRRAAGLDEPPLYIGDTPEPPADSRPFNFDGRLVGQAEVRVPPARAHRLALAGGLQPCLS